MSAHRPRVAGHGYTTALAVGFGILLAAVCVTAPLVRKPRRS
ncbi:hypothetical protein ACFV2X_24615 [Streptomyces sp. NPDC059679]